MGSAGNPGGQDVRDSALGTGFNQGNTFCLTNLPIGVNKNGTAKTATDAFFGTPGAEITGSDVDRWGLGVVQEIDSAAMHLFARWQHLSSDLSATDVRAIVQDPNSVRHLRDGWGAPSAKVARPTSTLARTLARASKISTSSKLAA